LQRFHKGNPAEPGFRPSQLSRTALSSREQYFFQPAIVELVQSKNISIKDGLLFATGHKATLSDEQRDWQKISACLQKQGNQIPVVTQLEKECGVDNRALMYSIGRAQREGAIIKISEKRYALVPVLGDFAQAALDLTEDESELTVVGYRDHMGCGRNVAVDVLEYFDGIRFTRRVGEGRIILNRSLPAKLFIAKE
jgi:selenocysteine-specific elongation factor